MFLVKETEHKQHRPSPYSPFIPDYYSVVYTPHDVPVMTPNEQHTGASIVMFNAATCINKQPSLCQGGML